MTSDVFRKDLEQTEKHSPTQSGANPTQAVKVFVILVYLGNNLHQVAC